MSKTVQEVQAWLLSPDSVKVLLVEVQDVNKSSAIGDIETIYLSSRSYISNTGVNYNPCIVGGISYTESLNFNGNPTISFGDIELDNTDGSNDDYLKYYWNNRPINIYLGDARWTRADFALVFSGIVSDVKTKNRNSINLVILDTLSRLNTAITETKLGSGYISSNNIITGYAGSNVIIESNEEFLRPLTFGECFNVAPLHVSKAYYAGSVYGSLYMVNGGPIEDVIEVRDNGAPVDFIKINANGCFALINSSYGTITASVQGTYAGAYSSRLADVVTNILTNYGGSYKLSAGDLEFPAANTTPYVGYYCKDKENVLDVCYKLAASGGYQLVNTTVTAYVGSSIHQSTAGKVKLVKMDLSSISPIYYLTEDDMVLNSLQIDDTLPTRASYKLGYCKNWTVIDDNLAKAVSPDSITYFKEEWIPNRYVGSNEQALFKDTTEPNEENTFLIAEADAETEVLRRFNLFGQKRYIVKATYLPHMIFAQLGDGVQFDLRTPKFTSLLSGKKGIIYSVERNWLSNTISIGVLI